MSAKKVKTIKKATKTIKQTKVKSQDKKAAKNTSKAKTSTLKAKNKPTVKLAVKKQVAKKVQPTPKLKQKNQVKSKNKVTKQQVAKKISKKTEAKKDSKPQVKEKSALAKTILARGNAAKSEVRAEPVKAVEKKEVQKITVKKSSDLKDKNSFKIGEYAIYPSHGVGKITDIEKTVILGQDFNCYLMYFEKEKLTIKIPVNSVDKIGIRHLASKSQMDEVFTILRSGVKKLKGMWSRRAQEYETKINSGDIILLAEVLRDLTRDIEDGERSYSERIIYETAVHRLASEYTIVYNCSFEEARDKVVLTAKDKLLSERKAAQKDEFDEFDLHADKSEEDADEDEESEEEDEDEDEDADEDDDYEDDEDEDRPKKRAKR